MKIIDISDTYTVLGSGLSAISVVSTLRQYNKSISLIDYGNTKHDKFDEAEYLETSSEFISPKFRSRENFYVYSKFRKNLKIITSNFSAVGSFARGGLSNIWGGGLHPYDNENLRNYPYKLADVEDDYNFVSRVLTGKISSNEGDNRSDKKSTIDSRSIDLLKMRKKNDLKFSKSFNAIENEIESKESFYEKNNNVFSSSNGLEQFSNYEKFDHFNGKLIVQINKEGKFYMIETIDIQSNERIIYKSKIIFCCLGVISTTKLILKMEKAYEKKLPLLSTPGVSFLIYSPFKRNKTQKLSWFKSNLTFGINIKNFHINGSMFSFTNDLGINILKLNKFGNIIYQILNYFFFSRIFICNAFFPSDFSKNYISLKKNNDLNIEGYITRNTKKKFMKLRNELKKNFVMLGYIIPYIKLMRPGEDIHYAGTLPMKTNPYELQCSEKGELYNNDNMYITDASSMPYLPGKAHSFNMMVQARRIVRGVIDKK